MTVIDLEKRTKFRRNKKPKIAVLKAQQAYPGFSRLTIFTDGSFRPPGVGAWGYAVYNPKGIIDYKVEETMGLTINQLELMAIIQALEAYRGTPSILIRSDSMYAINSLTNWHKTWAKNHWKNGFGEEVKNKDLILRALAAQAQCGNVQYAHVKGHSGDVGNEVVNALVQTATYKGVQRLSTRQEAA